MATIIEKNVRRNRVQFTMSNALRKQYELCQERAKRLLVMLDFSKDFERWFAGQLEQADSQLKLREENNKQATAVKSSSFSALGGEGDNGNN